MATLDRQRRYQTLDQLRGSNTREMCDNGFNCFFGEFYFIYLANH